MKLKTHQVGQAGEHYVAAEFASTPRLRRDVLGDMPDLDILAGDVARDQTVSIQVKTKTAGTWQTSTKRGRRRKKKVDETDFWVFVDIGKNPNRRPDYFVAWCGSGRSAGTCSGSSDSPVRLTAGRAPSLDRR